MRMYVVVKLSNESDHDCLFEICHTVDEFSKFLSESVKPYEDMGYSIFIETVDHERYLNERLNWNVENFCDLDKDEQHIKEQALKGNVSVKVLLDTLNLIQSQKETIAYVIGSILRRMIRKGYNIENEIAVEIFNHKYSHNA